MANILILGAGQSAPYLIRHLLKYAERADHKVVVADRDLPMASARVAAHPAGTAVELDATDERAVAERVAAADVVVNFLVPRFQLPVAEQCVEFGVSMVSASYRHPGVAALDSLARDRDVSLVCEMGLDPGLDHLSSMRLIDELAGDGYSLRDFWSYGSGVPAKDSAQPPLRYAVTWNPRNVVMAGSAGAQSLENGHVRRVPYPELFKQTWSVDVPGVGMMEAYLNRDSLGYIDVYGIDPQTLVRATLRYPNYCKIWHAIARLGLPNETMLDPNLSQLSWQDLLASFLPAGDGPVRSRIASYLDLEENGLELEAFETLGLLSDKPIGFEAETPAQALIGLMQDKLRLLPDQRDMVILHHVLHAVREDGHALKCTSTLVEEGEAGGMTAMSKTVGLPAALTTELLLENKFPVKGAVIPTDRAIYEPLLAALEKEGLKFAETKEELVDA